MLLALADVPARAATGASRQIWMQNRAGEEVRAAYRHGETYDAAVLQRLRHLFRDLHEGTQGPLPEMLVDMLSVLQEAWGYALPLLLNSGFRTPRTNAMSEGAAPASLHLRGLAADVSMPGIDHPDLALVALSLSERLGFMGIGVYPRFVHLDVGPSRRWTRIGRGWGR
nr:DUF882 domain-containing protein [Pararoseomonas baculiformis]